MRNRGLSLLVVLVVAAGGCTGPDAGAEPWLQPIANDRLVGAWRPTDVERIGDSKDRWLLVFEDNGKWHGTDACNKNFGIFALFEDDTFVGGQTPGDFYGGVGCMSESVGYYRVMGDAARVDVAGDRAVFLAPDGDELMVIERLN